LTPNIAGLIADVSAIRSDCTINRGYRDATFINETARYLHQVGGYSTHNMLTLMYMGICVCLSSPFCIVGFGYCCG
jgi:hypothetical protein